MIALPAAPQHFVGMQYPSFDTCSRRQTAGRPDTRETGGEFALAGRPSAALPAVNRESGSLSPAFTEQIDALPPCAHPANRSG